MPTLMRRKYERFPFLVDLEVTDLATGRAYSGRGINLSRGGLGFFLPKFLPTGTRVRFRMPMRQGPILLTGTVMASQVEDAGAIMGAAFEQELTPAGQPALCSLADGKV